MGKTSTFEDMQIEKLRNHDGNIRAEVGDIDELADSIRAQGILQPLTVAPHPTLEGDYTVIAGHRRLAAAKRAGLSYLPVVINHNLVSKADQITAMLVENLQRADISSIEEAKAYQQLELEGLNLNKIAKATGRARKTVVERLKLTRLSEETQAKVAAHQVTIEKALDIARFADHPELVEQLENNLGSYDWSYTVKRADRQLEWLEVTRPALEKAADEAGIPRMDRPEGQRWDWHAKYQVQETSSLGVEDAAAGGWSLVLDEQSDKQLWGFWLRERTEAEEVPREPTEEEIAEAKAQAAREQMIQDLRTAVAVETDFLKALILAPKKKGVVLGLGARLVEEVVGDDVLKSLLGVQPGDDGYDFVMRKLSAEQLLLLLAFDHFREDIGTFHAWNPFMYYTGERLAAWRAIREDHLGYKLTPAEEVVAAHWAEHVREVEELRAADEADDDDFEDDGEDEA
ncbi:ParB/RepB/Spo0J family partition protein [Arthrobacter sp. JSM 101049]|uniref:ParB/RepB/Spo0J family partition protein n=1 Tax=Arthrobacter sp. JSM 101049 TaxID=929097 RepID=UPI00356277DD